MTMVDSGKKDHKVLMRDFCTYIKERRGCIKSIKFSELYVCVCACA